MRFLSAFMIGSMYPLFPAGISVFALMWVVSLLSVCGQASHSCVCGRVEVRGYMQAPFLLWQCLDVVRDPECTINQQIQEQIQL